MNPDLAEILRCPVTGQVLRETASGDLQAGDRVYPVIDGVPVLIAEERSVITIDACRPDERRQHGRVSRAGRIQQAIDRRLPALAYDGAGPHGRRSHFLALLRHEQGRKRLLVIGCGTDRLFEGETDVTVIDTDVFISAATDVVCDGHDLPFADESFDGVLIIAVLEHVADPPRVAGEITRVLKPGGLVYSDVPFLQHVHAGAMDFTRYTMLGHRRLFRSFETLLCEPSAGPASSLAWALDGVLLTMFSGNDKLWRIGIRLSRMCFGWIGQLDRWLLKMPGAADAACSTVFIGRKTSAQVEDRVVVREYRGATPTPRM